MDLISKNMKKKFLILQRSTLKSTVVQYNNWHTGVGMYVHIFESSQPNGLYVRALL